MTVTWENEWVSEILYKQIKYITNTKTMSAMNTIIKQYDSVCREIPKAEAALSTHHGIVYHG